MTRSIESAICPESSLAVKKAVRAQGLTIGLEDCWGFNNEIEKR